MGAVLIRTKQARRQSLHLMKAEHVNGDSLVTPEAAALGLVAVGDRSSLLSWLIRLSAGLKK